MPESVEIRLSNYQIEKAAARLSYQRAAVLKLRYVGDGRAVELAREAIASAEGRLAALLVDHDRLVQEQERRLRSRWARAPKLVQFMVFK